MSLRSKILEGIEGWNDQRSFFGKDLISYSDKQALASYIELTIQQANAEAVEKAIEERELNENDYLFLIIKYLLNLFDTDYVLVGMDELEVIDEKTLVINSKNNNITLTLQ